MQMRRRFEVWGRPPLAAALRSSKFPVETIEVFFSYGTARLLTDQIARRSSSKPSGHSEGAESASGFDEFEQGV